MSTCLELLFSTGWVKVNNYIKSERCFSHIPLRSGANKVMLCVMWALVLVALCHSLISQPIHPLEISFFLSTFSWLWLYHCALVLSFSLKTVYISWSCFVNKAHACCGWLDMVPSGLREWYMARKHECVGGKPCPHVLKVGGKS